MDREAVIELMAGQLTKIAAITPEGAKHLATQQVEALEAASQAVVPREPTPDMNTAGCTMLGHNTFWKAMYDARPSRPAQEEG